MLKALPFPAEGHPPRPSFGFSTYAFRYQFVHLTDPKRPNGAARYQALAAFSNAQALSTLELSDASTLMVIAPRQRRPKPTWRLNAKANESRGLQDGRSLDLQ
jgi:hypothetical protein